MSYVRCNSAFVIVIAFFWGWKIKAYQKMRDIATWLYGESLGIAFKILWVLIFALSQLFSMLQKMTYFLSAISTIAIFPYFTKRLSKIKLLTFSNTCIWSVKP